jgi:CRP-like cAMP-binding protein
VPWDTLAGALLTTRGGLGTQVLGLKLLRLPRLLRLSRILRKLQTLASNMTFRIALLLLVYLVVAHWAACLFHYLSKWQVWNASAGWVDAATGVVPWLVLNCLQFSGCTTRYVASLYWAFTTMATVGYGDIVPATNLERAFAVALELVAGVLQGVVFGNMGMALHGMDSSRTELRRHLGDLTSLAKTHSLPPPLATRVRASAKRLWKRRLDVDTSCVTEALSGCVHSRVLASLDYGTAIMRAPLFRDMPPAFMRCLLARLQVHAVLPGEVVAHQGDPAEELYFIHAGAVTAHLQAGQRLIFTQGDLFGESDAVLCRRRGAKYVAEGAATLYSLRRDDVDAALAEFPELIGALTAHCLSREANLRRASSEVVDGCENTASSMSSWAMDATSAVEVDTASLSHATQHITARVQSRRLAPATTGDGPRATALTESSPAVWSRPKHGHGAAMAGTSEAAPAPRHIPLTPRFVDHTPRVRANSCASSSSLDSTASEVDWTGFTRRLAQAMDVKAACVASIDARLQLMQEKQQRAMDAMDDSHMRD